MPSRPFNPIFGKGALFFGTCQPVIDDRQEMYYFRFLYVKTISIELANFGIKFTFIIAGYVRRYEVNKASRMGRGVTLPGVPRRPVPVLPEASG